MNSFFYVPDDHESEQASNSYLMSMLAFMVGLPLPVINLIATVIFFIGNRKSTYFVRWHCTQAFLSQLTVLVMNSVAFTWTMRILFSDINVSNSYIAYLITVFLFNTIEIVATIYAAQQVRKGNHVHLWFFGDLTDKICTR
jgi:uncharacterized membrane protein